MYCVQPKQRVREILNLKIRFLAWFSFLGAILYPYSVAQMMEVRMVDKPQMY